MRAAFLLAALAFAFLLAALAFASCAPDTEAPAPVGTRMVTDAVTGAMLPRAVMPEQPDTERRVNAHLDTLSASLRCLNGVPVETRASVTLATTDVLSVSIAVNGMCDGSEPTRTNRSVTYDLATGQPVPFDALWRDYGADRSALAGVLAATLAPPAIMADEACTDVVSAEALESATFRYALTPDGLLVQPELPDAVDVCSTEALVPYASVSAFAAPGGVLSRSASAQR